MNRGGKIATTITVLGAIAGIISLNFVPGFQGFRDSTLAQWGGANSDCDGSEKLAAYYEIDHLFAKQMAVAEIHKHEVRASEEPGRVDLTVFVKREPGAPALDAILVSGVYGAKNPEAKRNFIEDDEDELLPGECATWRVRFDVPEDVSESYKYTVYGAWGERPYCFAVLTYPETKSAGWRAVHTSEPYCFVAHWENSWGEMKSPPDVTNAAVELDIR